MVKAVDLRKVLCTIDLILLMIFFLKIFCVLYIINLASVVLLIFLFICLVDGSIVECSNRDFLEIDSVFIIKKFC